MSDGKEDERGWEAPAIISRFPQAKKSKSHTAFRIPNFARLAAKGFDYGSADRKTHCHALGLSGKKRMKAGHDFFILSRTGIAYSNRVASADLFQIRSQSYLCKV